MSQPNLFLPDGRVNGRALRWARVRAKRAAALRTKLKRTPPWRRLPKAKLAESALRAWRRFAEAAAKAKGARRACGLCKRATMGAAKVTVKFPWGTTTPRWRWLCSECCRNVVWWLEDQEYELDRFDLPVDPVAVGITKGGKRGSFLKR